MLPDRNLDEWEGAGHGRDTATTRPRRVSVGLPLDRFWALHAGPRDPKDTDAARYLSSHGVLLRRRAALSSPRR